METHESYKYYALFGVLLSWVFGLVLSYRTKHVDVKTTSELALTSKFNYFIFAGGITLAGVFTSITTYGYMRYNLTVPDLYYYLYGFCMLLQFLTAWVPDSKGLKHFIHYFAAWIMSYLLLSLGALLLVETEPVQITRTYQFFGLLMLIAMAAVGTYAGREGATKKQFLRSQQTYFMLFQILLITRIYG